MNTGTLVDIPEKKEDESQELVLIVVNRKDRQNTFLDEEKGTIDLESHIETHKTELDSLRNRKHEHLTECGYKDDIETRMIEIMDTKNQNRELMMEYSQLKQLRRSYNTLGLPVDERYKQNAHYIREHPQHYELFEEIFEKHLLVNVGITETIFATLQPGFNVEVESDTAKALIQDFMNDPNIKFDEFLFCLNLDYYIYGDAYWQIVVEGNQIVELQIIPPQWMYVDADARNRVYGYYEFSPYGTNFFMPDEIYHWKRYGYRKPYGMSICTPLIDTIRRSLDIWQDAILTLHDYGSPARLWTFGDKDHPNRFSPSYIKDFMSKAKQMMRDCDVGVKFGVDVKVIDTREAIIDYISYIKHTDLDMISGLQTPPSSFARGDVRGETASESLETFDKRNQVRQKANSINVLIPILRKLLEINGVQRKNKKLAIHWNKFERIERDKKEQNLVKMKEAGIITPNEAREMIGKTDKIKWKDPETGKVEEDWGDYAQYRDSGANNLGVTAPSTTSGKPASQSKQKPKGVK